MDWLFRTAQAGRKIRVLLADDHAIVRQGLSNLLKSEPDMEVVAEASDGESAVIMARELKPDVVLIDISMPVMNGIRATRLIHSTCPEARIIGFSMFPEAQRGAAMREAGAVDYISKSDSSGIISAIRSCSYRYSSDMR